MSDFKIAGKVTSSRWFYPFGHDLSRHSRMLLAGTQKLAQPLILLVLCAKACWSIWQFSSFLIEGEFHAVWWSPQGELIDVSMKADGETEILIVRDGARKYQGRRLDNMRLAIGKNPAVYELIRKKKQFFTAFEAIFSSGTENDLLTPELARLDDEIRRLGHPSLRLKNSSSLKTAGKFGDNPSQKNQKRTQP